jgi:hypothetical protein
VGIALAVIYLPLLALFCVASLVLWVRLCVRGYPPNTPFALSVAGAAAGLGATVAATVLAINWVPPKPDFGQLFNQIGVSLLMPPVVGTTVAMVARRAMRKQGTTTVVRFASAFGAGAFAGTIGVPWYYFVRYF